MSAEPIGVSSYASPGEYEQDLEPRRGRRTRRENLRLVNDDLAAAFTWSDPVPTRRRTEETRPAAPARAPLSTSIPAPTAAPAPTAPSVAPTDLPFAAVRPAPEAETPAAFAPAERRTVVIRGRGAERQPVARRGYEAQLRRHERSGFKPDRVALWAVVLGIALLLAAVTSAHAAGLAPGLLHHLATR